MTVAENIGFSLARWPRAQRQARVNELTGLLGLEGLEGRLPGSISGGQQQRVALGRALAARPSVLLLDEPFSALDASIRGTLRREVTRLRRQLGLLALFVTHDLQEAFALADSIAVYDAGAVLQYGPRDTVFHSPATTRVAQLLEARNIFEGRVLSKNEAFVEVQTPWFRARARPDAGVVPGDRAAVCVRPEHVIVLRKDRAHSTEIDAVLEVEIEDEVATGNSHRLYLRIAKDGSPTDAVIEADVPAHPYRVMGIAARRDWHIALPIQETVAIPL
jgi:molybdate transport system ATP-binding protein